MRFFAKDSLGGLSAERALWNLSASEFKIDTPERQSVCILTVAHIRTVYRRRPYRAED